MMKKQPKKGDLWFDSRDEQFYFNDGTQWINCLSDDLYDPSEHMEQEDNALVNVFRGLCWSAFILGAAAIGYWSLTTTLHDMTVRDCNLGVQAACEELKR